MKVIKTLTLVAALTACQPALLMADATNPRIAVIDMRAVVASSPQAKAVSEKLKSEFKAREEQILATEKALKDKSEKLQRNSAVMSEAEKAKLEKEVVTAQRDLQRMQAEYREDATIRQQEEMKKLVEKINTIVQDVAKKEKYDLIIHAEAASFVSNSINITDKVVKSVSGTA